MELKKVFAKIKSVKNIELYVALALAALVCLVVFATSSKADNSTQETSDFDEYIKTTENKISSVLAGIDGCDSVRVAITYSSAEEKVYAYETETKQNADGTTTETKQIVTVSGEPVIVKTLPPQIEGVVVVCSGADDPTIRVKIKQVVVTLLNVDIDKVQVLT